MSSVHVLLLAVIALGKYITDMIPNAALRCIASSDTQLSPAAEAMHRGCFLDRTYARDLAGYRTEVGSHNSPHLCKALCAAEGK